MKNYTIGEITLDEIDMAADVIRKVFDKFVAPDYCDEGIRHFLEFITPKAIKNRISTDSFMLVARYIDQIVGVTEVRDQSHISLLFTLPDWQGRGIAKNLLNAAIERCHEKNKKLSQMTVNSSPYAIAIYEKLEFVCCGKEQIIDGIRFTPMVKNLFIV